MARPSQIDEQRRRLLPIVSRAFSELGYHRATTAELARRCGVRENILYRLWADKRAMFLAVIADMFRSRAEQWTDLLADERTPEEAVSKLIAYETEHLGRFGLYRVLFTALTEPDDPEMQSAIRRLYRQFHKRISELIESRRTPGVTPKLPGDTAAWSVMGLATIANIIRELDLLPARTRKAMFREAAQYLVSGQ